MSGDDRREPMLASLTEGRFSDSGWHFERKLDGERALCIRDGDPIELRSCNRKSLNATYPEIVALNGRGGRRYLRVVRFAQRGKHDRCDQDCVRES